MIENGGLILDFTQPTSPTNNIIVTLTDAWAARNTSQGIISKPVVESENRDQLAGFQPSFFDKGYTIVQVGQQLTLAAIWRSAVSPTNTGAAAAFVPTSLLSDGQGTVPTTSTNVNGILGGWATMSGGVISAQGFNLPAGLR